MIIKSKVNWSDIDDIKRYTREYNKKYQERNKEKLRKQRKKLRKQNIDEVRMKDRKYYQKNKEIIKERKRIPNKNYYKKNKKKMNAQSRKHYEQNKDLRSIQSKKYRDKNKIKLSNAHKIYYNEKLKKFKCIICGKPAYIKYCSTECTAIGISGENHFRWNGGHKGYDKNWTANFRRKIRDRDNNICMRCRKPREILNKALAVHHIDGNSKNTCDENCISLCNSCHSIVEASGKKIEVFQPLFQKILSKLYGYKYVG